MTNENLLCAQVLRFIDLGGDERYLKTALYGMTAMLPSYALLCISARAPNLPRAAREHIAVALALGIPLAAVLTQVCSAQRRCMVLLWNLLHCASLHRCISFCILILRMQLTCARRPVPFWLTPKGKGTVQKVTFYVSCIMAAISLHASKDRVNELHVGCCACRWMLRRLALWRAWWRSCAACSQQPLRAQAELEASAGNMSVMPMWRCRWWRPRRRYAQFCFLQRFWP